MTYFWREHKNYYRLQTDDKELHQRLKRRKDADLCAEGINCNLWVYRFEFSTLKNARIGMARLGIDGLKIML